MGWHGPARQLLCSGGGGGGGVAVVLVAQVQRKHGIQVVLLLKNIRMQSGMNILVMYLTGLQVVLIMADGLISHMMNLVGVVNHGFTQLNWILFMIAQRIYGLAQ